MKRFANLSLFKYIIPLFLIITALKAQENNNLKWLEYDPRFQYSPYDSSKIYEIIINDPSGLKNDSLNNFKILVERINENSLGITREHIEDITYMALFANGIKPVKNNDNFLYINITTTSMAFQISLEFQRTVFYLVNRKKYRNFTSATWVRGTTGTHGQKKMYITDALRELIDKFSIDYIKVNK